MANNIIKGPDQLVEPDTLLQQLNLHKAWLDHEPGGLKICLRQRNLSGFDLRGYALAEAELGDAILTGAQLSGVSLRGADLAFCSLRGADLRNADLSGTDLRFAALDGADLTGADFSGAQLTLSSLDGVRMSWYDHTLISERLWRAAGNDVELRMVAAFVGRTVSRCWDNYRELGRKHRHWILNNFILWKRDGDEAPPLLENYINLYGNNSNINR